MNPVEEEIRKVLEEHGQLLIPVESIDARGDLYESGLTSHACVNVMLALEETFDVEFPDAMLRKSTFESIAALEGALVELGASTPVE